MWDCKPVATPMDSALVAAATDYQCTSEFRPNTNQQLAHLCMQCLEPDLI